MVLYVHPSHFFLDVPDIISPRYFRVLLVSTTAVSMQKMKVVGQKVKVTLGQNIAKFGPIFG